VAALDDAEAIDLGTGQEALGANVTFRAVPLARVSGTLVSASGPLPDGTWVELVRTQVAVGEVAGGATPDGQERFLISGLAPRSYRAIAVAALEPGSGTEPAILQQIAAAGRWRTT
jgi:hypothetical protein